MDGRSRNPVIMVGDAQAYARQLAGYDKYLCGSCKSLRLGRKDVRSRVCGQCGSSNIDVETDMASMRLEEKRLLGDPELAKAVLEAVQKDAVEQASRKQ